MRIVTVGDGDMAAGRWKVTTPLRLAVETMEVDLDPGDYLELRTYSNNPGVPEAIWPALRRGDLELLTA